MDEVVRHILKVRLFGYGVPYRAAIDDHGGVTPAVTTPEREASDLANALARLSGGDAVAADIDQAVTVDADQAATVDSDWTVSVPFGRCGMNGQPHEHLLVYEPKSPTSMCWGPMDHGKLRWPWTSWWRSSRKR